jgi:hypothetical protein
MSSFGNIESELNGLELGKYQFKRHSIHCLNLISERATEFGAKPALFSRSKTGKNTSTKHIHLIIFLNDFLKE